jgi:hypothetical protein
MRLTHDDKLFILYSPAIFAYLAAPLLLLMAKLFAVGATLVVARTAGWQEG